MDHAAFPPRPHLAVSLEGLLRDPALLDQVPPEAVPALLAELEGLRAALWRRMLQAEAGKVGRPEPEGDRLLGRREAAEILGYKPAWLSRHGDQLPFTVPLPSGERRYSYLGVQEFIRRRRGGKRY